MLYAVGIRMMKWWVRSDSVKRGNAAGNTDSPADGAEMDAKSDTEAAAGESGATSSLAIQTNKVRKKRFNRPLGTHAEGRDAAN